MEIPMTLYCFVQNLDKASDDDDDNWPHFDILFRVYFFY